MKSSAKLFLRLFGVLVIGVLVASLLFEKIPPATIGVKQFMWGGGIVDEDYELGYHLGISGYHRWHFLDQRTHFVTFSRSRRSSRSNSQEQAALEIRTRDNNTAAVDVTVTYRITPGEGHMIVQEGLKEAYRDRVKSTVEGVLREELAQLSPEDFVSTEIRMERAANILPVLAEAMAIFHVTPETIMIRAVRFPPEYENKLQKKQLTRQLAKLAPALQAVEEQLQVTGTIEKQTEAFVKTNRAEWDKQLQTMSSNNEVQIAEVLAEANVYQETTRAEADKEYVKLLAVGDLALAKAEALRNELRNVALDSRGGRIYLGIEAARNLRIESVTLNSNDPSVPSIIELDKLVKILVGEPPAP
jgi:regulator of protease activity HflC (stomatin/prohibitin superfamily)